MSYILDALKKAEQKRQFAARVPSLATVHRAPEAPRLRLWPWIAAIVVLVNAGALAWLLYARTSIDGAVAPAPPVASVSPPPATTPPAFEPAAPPAAVPAPKASAEARRPLPPAAESRPRVTVKPVERGAAAPTATSPTQTTPRIAGPAAATAGPPSPSALPAATAPRVTAPPARDVAAPGAAMTEKAAPERPAPPPPTPAAARPPDRASAPAASAPRPLDTPQAVQDFVSKLRLQMVVYSEVPSERLVFINDRKYLEGGEIDGQIRVEAITPDGAVLAHQGRRFVIRQ